MGQSTKHNYIFPMIVNIHVTVAGVCKVLYPVICYLVFPYSSQALTIPLANILVAVLSGILELSKPSSVPAKYL